MLKDIFLDMKNDSNIIYINGI